MLASTSLVLAGLIALANAHFQLQFPPPRGVFVEDDEPTFCDGYDAVADRTVFPLSGGFFSLNSEHTSWTASVSLTNKADPTKFDDFSTIVPFFKLTGEGLFCLPLDLLTTNATGLTDGQNVTLEIIFDGGDGELFQCADLTLSSTAKISSSVSCTNGTASASSTATATSASGATAGSTSGSVSGSATSPAGSTSATSAQGSSAVRFESGYFSVLLGLLGVAAAAI
ncbi:hypothetical protein DFH09DRAFT_1180511 [Mycena vulgaris]|nr:hypothetical protein DFH09DRAFT_1180511 [Mycena vulgaris]